MTWNMYDGGCGANFLKAGRVDGRSTSNIVKSARGRKNIYDSGGYSALFIIIYHFTTTRQYYVFVSFRFVRSSFFVVCFVRFPPSLQCEIKITRMDCMEVEVY